MASTSNILETAASNEPKPENSPWAQQTRRAALQKIAEGTPDEVQEACVDLEALGDLEPDLGWEEGEDGGDEGEELLDSEVDNSDEDDPFQEGWDEEPLDPPEVQIRATSGTDEADEDLTVGSTWHFMIHDAECRFERPTWIRWRSKNKSGKDALDDIERRLKMMERIASWLTTYRREFLIEPDPWRLGCAAWAEFKEGRAPVVPEHFLQVARIEDLCGDSLFSRYRRKALLEWPDATLSLDFLFKPEARMAWVANTVRQAAAEFKTPVSEILAKHKAVTKPKDGAKRRKLGRISIEHLEWPELIARANSLAGTKWADVLAAYKNRILKD